MRYFKTVFITRHFFLTELISFRKYVNENILAYIKSVRALIITSFFNEIFRTRMKLGNNRSILLKFSFKTFYCIYMKEIYFDEKRCKDYEKKKK